MFAPPEITLLVSAGTDDATVAALPTSHGVVCFVRDDAPITVVATADLRALVLSRLGSEAAAERDLRGACDEVRCWLAGSSFEADLRFLDVAAHVAPALASQAAGRLTVWWLSVDHDRAGEGWVVAEEPRVSERVSVLGPFLDRSSARRWGEMLDDLFELCRFPGELRKAPGGTACAYHEMGRCPAVCNGSEPMGAYLGRLREAVDLDAHVLGTVVAELREQMQRASAEADFERAAGLRDRLEALPSADDRWVSVVGAVHDLDAIALAAAPRGTHVQVLRVNRTAWRRLGEVDVAEDGERDSLDGMLNAPLDDGSLSAVGGVLARELIRPRRGGPVLIPWAEASVDRVWSAAQRAAKIDTPGDSAGADREGPPDA